MKKTVNIELDEKTVLFELLRHFELEDSYPISVNAKEMLVAKKHLKSYLLFNKSNFSDRPFQLTRKKNKKLSKDLSIFFFKELFLEQKQLLENLENNIIKALKNSGGV